MWAEITVAAIAIGAILGFVALLNAYTVPLRVLQRDFAARGEVMPEGFTQGYGVPISIVLLIASPS